MKIAAALLQQWYSQNPARLLQAALLQAERLAQMAPELEVLRAQNAWLHEQLEAKTKRIAQLESRTNQSMVKRIAKLETALSLFAESANDPWIRYIARLAVLALAEPEKDRGITVHGPHRVESPAPGQCQCGLYFGQTCARQPCLMPAAAKDRGGEHD